MRDVRKDHNDTQASLGKKLNVATPTVSKWEQGASEPSLEMLKKICRLYQVTSDYLLGLSDDDPLLEEKNQEILSSESKKALNLFKEYLIYKDKQIK